MKKLAVFLFLLTPIRKEHGFLNGDPFYHKVAEQRSLDDGDAVGVFRSTLYHLVKRYPFPRGEPV